MELDFEFPRKEAIIAMDAFKNLNTKIDHLLFKGFYFPTVFNNDIA